MCFKLFCSNVSGSGTTRRTFEFGRTHVVMPRGKHQATIVWLHGLGDKGSRNVETDCFGFFMANAHAEGNKLLTWKEIVGEIMGNWSQILETFPLPNIKWICPTAPTRSVALFGGFPVTAWFDVGDISEDACDDLEGLDASAAHVANFLSTEPADIKLGVGGFSMGAATALYSATCHVLGQYGSGNLYPVNLSAIVGLSGWLPCSRTLRNRMVGLHEATRSAASLPILLCHGIGDDVVAYKHGQKSAQVLSSAGFQNVTFRTYNGLGHYTVPEETNDVCNWLTATLALEGSQIY